VGCFFLIIIDIVEKCAVANRFEEVFFLRFFPVFFGGMLNRFFAYILDQCATTQWSEIKLLNTKIIASTFSTSF